MKTFVIGDIHGTYRALLQCFKRSGFDYSNDHLIVLGDVCDRYSEVRQCIDELLKIKHCDYIIGNHDLWAIKWASSGWKENIWLGQGGMATIDSYAGQSMPQAHLDFLKKAPFFFEYEAKIFVHGGFDPQKLITQQDQEEFVWDRALIAQAQKVHNINSTYNLSEFKEIYLGHTPTTKLGSTKPLKLCNVWAMDTGAGWGNRLSIMDIATKEYWQSDLTAELYPAPH